MIDGIGVLALVGLFWFFRNCDEFDPFLYQGGFLVLSLVTAVAIGVAAHPASFLGAKVLGNKVLTCDRRAVLRHLPVALAAVHDHPARPRPAVPRLRRC